MAQVIVRNLEDDIKEALRQRARQHGWSTAPKPGSWNGLTANRT
ncbi:FitA-like ribbon-helix-helix domain-containing protein [Halorhodospira halochloris]